MDPTHIYMFIYNCSGEVCVLLDSLIDVCGNQFARYYYCYQSSFSFPEQTGNCMHSIQPHGIDPIITL